MFESTVFSIYHCRQLKNVIVVEVLNSLFTITPTLLGNGLLANVLRVEVVCNLNE
jgi:hypothetical protein